MDIIIISGSSCAGKYTVIQELMKRNPHLCSIPSDVTRPMRPGEYEGVPHCFVTEQEFSERDRRGEYAVTERIHGIAYGVRYATLVGLAGKYSIGLKEMGVCGAVELQKRLRTNTKSVFLDVPYEELERRFQLRGTFITRNGCPAP